MRYAYYLFDRLRLRERFSISTLKILFSIVHVFLLFGGVLLILLPRRSFFLLKLACLLLLLFIFYGWVYYRSCILNVFQLDVLENGQGRRAIEMTPEEVRIVWKQNNPWLPTGLLNILRFVIPLAMLIIAGYLFQDLFLFSGRRS